jgi:hypothetical protein
MSDEMRVWCIGPDGTEYYCARSEEEMRAYYISLIGEAEAHEDLEEYFEEVPDSKMDEEFEYDLDGEKIRTTWRKLLEGVKEPTQISSGYC